MHLSIFAALWCGSLCLILSAGHMIHVHQSKKMAQMIHQFEQDWNKLEKKYETTL